ncbi:MAG: class I SAM-dependent methyltransferase [Propionibacteriaceae bacterium]|nr:class I SAM-dependent methyltransferase [Propionibacteriaceae bacterium]
MTFQQRIDEQLHVYYSTGNEARRLSKSLGGRLEFVRTLELVQGAVPAGARITDIGGANGVYAAPLAEAGYAVVLVDPVAYQVEEARRHGTFDALVGDARQLPFSDGEFDAALLLGPLYHLQSRADRVGALREASRVVKPGGLVIAAVISRMSAFTDSYFERAEQGLEPWFDEGAQILADGWHDAPEIPFPFGHFHTGPELHSEAEEAGLTVEAIHGVEGPLALAAEYLPADHPSFESQLQIAREYSLHPGLREAGPHMLLIGRAG